MIFTTEMISPLYDILEPCKLVSGDEVHHPEGSVYTHSFQTVRHAIKETDSTDMIIAALMHDVGKAVNRLNHDKESVKLVSDYVSQKTLWLIGQHMRVWYLLEGTMRRYSKAQYLLTHPWLPELIALARWDRMGRVANYHPCIDIDDFVAILNDKASRHFTGTVNE